MKKISKFIICLLSLSILERAACASSSYSSSVGGGGSSSESSSVKDLASSMQNFTITLSSDNEELLKNLLDTEKIFINSPDGSRIVLRETTNTFPHKGGGFEIHVDSFTHNGIMYQGAYMDGGLSTEKAVKIRARVTKGYLSIE